MSAAPVILDLEAMMVDPFPYFAAMQASDTWTWSDPMQMWLVTRFADVVAVDQQPDIFSSEVPGALLTRSIGLTMIRSEGERHARLRGASDAPLKRRAIQSGWSEVIADLVREHLEPLRARSSFDLVQDYAAPLVGACLRAVLGLDDASPSDIERWSDAYIAGAINNTDDPAVWRTAEAAAREVHDCVVAAIGRVRRVPDRTVVSAMAAAHPDTPLTATEIAANIRLMIAGGFNDARDALATMPWLLLTHPHLCDRAASNPRDFERAIDETVRWLSPVGSYPRILTQDYTSPAAQLRSGDRVLVVAAAANRDPSVFPRADEFDIDRPNLDDHLGFSVGAHYCLGSHLVRAIMRAAVPGVLDLPGIRPAAAPKFRGWQFRGPVSVPMTLTGAGADR